MSNRVLQERCVFPNGISTDWDVSTVQVPHNGWGMDDKAWSRFVRDLNAKAKADGDFTRFRSVEVDD